MKTIHIYLKNNDTVVEATIEKLERLDVPVIHKDRNEVFFCHKCQKLVVEQNERSEFILGYFGIPGQFVRDCEDF